MSGSPLLLIVDDEPAVLNLIARVAEREGFEAVTCADGRTALRLAAERPPALALVDLRMPDIGGVEIVKRLKQADSKIMVVLMTGHASIDSAVEAVKEGAADYLTKPLDLERLKGIFGHVCEETLRRSQLMAADCEVARRAEFAGMIGRGPAMQDIFDLIRRFAPHVRTALVTGETGCGKELVAQALHQCGPRRGRRFVAVNCSAVVPTLFESELFGHARGAFTGATDAKPGLFEQADGGTLFLDEIGELPLALQAKLLRVLETGEVQRVGSLQPVRTDVRVLCATNRELAEEAAAGRFRTDLLYRLNVVQIRLPPLRERREDIPLLAASFIREFGDRFRKNISGLTSAAERQLLTAAWPGNVRQLRNVLERACMLIEDDVITDRDINLDATAFQSANSTSADVDRTAAFPSDNKLSAIEREHIVRTINEAGGNKAMAARQLGLSRRALYRRLERHGLAKPAKGPASDTDSWPPEPR